MCQKPMFLRLYMKITIDLSRKIFLLVKPDNLPVLFFLNYPPKNERDKNAEFYSIQK